MTKEELIELKKQLSTLTEEEQKERDLYLRGLANGELQGPPVGYPSIDKPWLRYYSKEHVEAELPHMSAYEYLKLLNKDNLDLQAIDSEVGNYTYRELFTMIDKTATSLFSKGIKKGDIVLTMLPVLPHESFVFYGIDKVGAAMCQLPPQSTVEEVCDYINKFNVDVFFTFNQLLTPEMEESIYKNTKVKNIINIGFSPLTRKHDERTISWDKFIEEGQKIELPTIERSPKDLLFLASTGGSTGTPKSVMLNDDCFNIIVHQFINSDVNYNVGDKWIRLWPIFSASAAVSNHHLPLCTGGNDLLRNFPIDMRIFDQMILKDKPNHMIMIPQLIDILEQSEILANEDLSFVKTAGCGGLAITPQFEERVNKFYKAHNIDTFLGYGWGCTEHSSSVAMRSNFETTSIGTAGAPMVNTNVAVFNPETLEEVEYGTEGELCINSETVMMGYYGDEELTNRVIKQHPDGSTWLHTGDLGIMSKDGIITVKGRMTRMIFVFPTAKIYPQAIESAISKVEGVQEVAICEVPDTEHEGFYLPICFIVPKKNSDNKTVEENVQKMCNDTLPEHARPKEIYTREELPLTKVGKPDIRALEAELRQQQQKSTIKKVKKLI